MRHKNIRRLHHNQQLASLNEKRRQFQWKQQQKQQQSQKPKFFEKNTKKYEKLIQKPTSASREPPQQVFYKEKQPLSPGRPQVNIYFSLTNYLGPKKARFLAKNQHTYLLKRTTRESLSKSA